MPWKLVQVSPRGWFVEDVNGRRYSRRPLPKKRAAAQLRAIYANAGKKHWAGLVGAGRIPPSSELHKIAQATRSPTRPQTIGAFQLIDQTPTLVFYANPSDHTVVVGVRGTQPTNAQDLKADLAIGLNDLEGSERFKKDLGEVVRVQQSYPHQSWDWFGTGHSLGGAICDQLLRMGFIQRAVTYNPAIQPNNVHASNERHYIHGDFLQKTLGKLDPHAKVRKDKSTLRNVLDWVPYANLTNPITRHALENFEGGSDRCVS